MRKLTSIWCQVTQWQYNKNALWTNLRTAAQVTIHPVYHPEGNESVGLCLRWYLTIYANDIEINIFSSEEVFSVTSRNITDNQLQEMIFESYVRAYGESAIRNWSVGLCAGFPELEEIEYDLGEIRKAVDMPKQAD